MRDIKFRGMKDDMSNPCMLYGTLHIRQDSFGTVYTIEHCVGDFEYVQNSVIPSTVGQYTGRKDRNLNKIYDGDIVITHFEKTPAYEAYTEKGVVESHWNSFVPTTIVDKVHGKNNGIYSHSEVIGNIYENPELLNQK